MLFVLQLVSNVNILYIIDLAHNYNILHLPNYKIHFHLYIYLIFVLHLENNIIKIVDKIEGYVPSLMQKNCDVECYKVKVILLKNLKNYGKKNDIITVADGYAKNYLLPQKIAIVASSQALVQLGKQQQKFDHEVNEKKLENEALKLEIEKIILNFDLKINKDKVFGAITSKQIIEKLSQEYNIQLDKKQLVNYQNINTIGINNISIKLFNDIFTILKIQVVGKK